MNSIKIKIVPRDLSNFISSLIPINKTIWLEVRKNCLQARTYDENLQNIKSLSLEIENTDFEKTFKINMI